MKTAREVSDIDKHVSNQIRTRRFELRMSQGDLADRLGVTFQQVQKYEKGMNRVSAGRLYEMAGILDVPLGYFFEGLDATTDTAQASILSTIIRSPDGIRLASAFAKLSAQDRRHLFALAASLAEPMEAEA